MRVDVLPHRDAEPIDHERLGHGRGNRQTLTGEPTDQSNLIARIDTASRHTDHAVTGTKYNIRTASRSSLQPPSDVGRRR
jgi:hypothetical protein